jgi:hypothetical protein
MLAHTYAHTMSSEAEPLTTAQFTRWWKETGEFELRQLLHWRWDPIGISGAFPSAADEYDSYAPQIVSALSERASSDQIAQLLSTIEQDRMGLGHGPGDRGKSVAADILAWFGESQARWINFGPLRH